MQFFKLSNSAATPGPAQRGRRAKTSCSAGFDCSLLTSYSKVSNPLARQRPLPLLERHELLRRGGVRRV
jgi:hypothetical protein